jgi:hypothetical protein
MIGLEHENIVRALHCMVVDKQPTHTAMQSSAVSADRKVGCCGQYGLSRCYVGPAAMVFCKCLMRLHVAGNVSCHAGRVLKLSSAHGAQGVCHM